MPVTVMYTNTDRIRSVLGLSAKDMSDAQVTDRNLATELRLQLASWLPTYATHYTAGKAPGATEALADIADGIELYCTYYCAQIIATSPSLSLATPQQVSDGKNQISRFNQQDWENFRRLLEGKANHYRAIVEKAVNSVSSATGPKFFSAVALGTDPVTT